MYAYVFNTFGEILVEAEAPSVARAAFKAAQMVATSVDVDMTFEETTDADDRQPGVFEVFAMDEQFQDMQHFIGTAQYVMSFRAVPRPGSRLSV